MLRCVRVGSPNCTPHTREVWEEVVATADAADAAAAEVATTAVAAVVVATAAVMAAAAAAHNNQLPERGGSNGDGNGRR